MVNNHNFAAKGFPHKEKRENGNGDPMVDLEAEWVSESRGREWNLDWNWNGEENKD